MMNKDKIRTAQRIVLIGASGSGKSTLARKLESILNISVEHMDKFYHSTTWPNTEGKKLKIWQRKADEIVTRKSWILDGCNKRIQDVIFCEADIIIFLDLKRHVYMRRLLKRRIQYHRKKRPDMPADWNERLKFSFLRLVWNYNKTYKKNLTKTLDRYADKVLVLNSSKAVTEFVQFIQS